MTPHRRHGGRAGKWRAGLRVARRRARKQRGQPPPTATKKAATEPHTGFLRTQWAVIPLPYYFTAERRGGAQAPPYTFVNTSTKHPTTNVNVRAHFTYTLLHVNLQLAKDSRGRERQGGAQRADDAAPQARQQGKKCAPLTGAPPAGLCLSPTLGFIRATRSAFLIVKQTQLQLLVHIVSL